MPDCLFCKYVCNLKLVLLSDSNVSVMSIEFIHCNILMIMWSPICSYGYKDNLRFVYGERCSKCPYYSSCYRKRICDPSKPRPTPYTMPACPKGNGNEVQTSLKMISSVLMITYCFGRKQNYL